METKTEQLTPADQAKVDGNKAMGAQNYDEALKKYTEAIELADKPNHIYYSNRAAVYLQQMKYDECIEDCDKAIEIDKVFYKSHYRKSKALLGKQETLDAMRATVQGLKLNPGQPELAQLARLIDRMLQVEKKKKQDAKTPITILTGFLGSGKTTLLNRILKENHGKKIAVIENEFGAIGVDEKLVLDYKMDEEAIIEVMNGCICCTVREDLTATLLDMKAKYVDTGKIDYIIIETTGMADPAPVIQTFYAKPEIEDWSYVDACITVADGTCIVDRLNDDREEGCENEAVEQVCFADKVLLNKIDLCNEQQLKAAEKKIREFNKQCPIEHVQLNNADIPFKALLNQKFFSIEKALEIDEGLLEEDAEHKHDSRIGTFSYKMKSEMSTEGANKFIGQLLREQGANIYRMKGFLAIEGSPMKYVFHSVGMIFNIEPLEEWKEEENRECIFVIIGKNLSQEWLESKFKEGAIASFDEVKHNNLEENLESKKK